eukprot:c7665_g1_i1.p1 GENE.c7665_g1_i1~~c7665_g1_i1.p1  ORF type:complete len:487 (+),score=109.59 c7665_g1_i1:77-1537(+)
MSLIAALVRILVLLRTPSPAQLLNFLSCYCFIALVHAFALESLWIFDLQLFFLFTVSSLVGVIVFGMFADMIGRLEVVRVLLLIIGGTCACVGVLMPFEKNGQTAVLVLGTAIAAAAPVSIVFETESVEVTEKHHIADRRILAGLTMFWRLPALGFALVIHFVFSITSAVVEIKAFFLLGTLLAIRIFYDLRNAANSEEFTTRSSTGTFDCLHHKAYQWRLLGVCLSSFFVNGCYMGSVVMVLRVARETISSSQSYGAALTWFTMFSLFIQIPSLLISLAQLQDSAPKTLQLLSSDNAVLTLLLLFPLFIAIGYGGYATAMIIPMEIFPPQMRCTCLGFSCAFGFIGGLLLELIARSSGLRSSAYAMCVSGAMGVIVTRFFIEKNVGEPDPTCLFRVGPVNASDSQKARKRMSVVVQEDSDEEMGSSRTPNPARRLEKEKQKLIAPSTVLSSTKLKAGTKLAKHYPSDEDDDLMLTRTIRSGRSKR